MRGVTLLVALGLFTVVLTAPCGAGDERAVERDSAPAPREAAVGEAVYHARCRPCHAKGLAGAPVVGDREAWEPRIRQGLDALVERSIVGYRGAKGFMPPRGGAPTLTDRQVAEAVRYMVEQSR